MQAQKIIFIQKQSHVNYFVIQNLFRQQQKLFQQSRVVQAQRLKTIRQLHEQYTKVLIYCESRKHRFANRLVDMEKITIMTQLVLILPSV